MVPFNPIVPLSILTSTFQAKYELDLKSKDVILNGQTLEKFPDLNHIRHRGNLTLF